MGVSHIVGPIKVIREYTEQGRICDVGNQRNVKIGL